LNFFRNISEAIQSDEISRLGTPRRKALQAHLRDTSQELFQFLAMAVVSLFPGAPELERSAVLLVTELASVLPLRAFLAADVDSWLRAKLLGDAAVRGAVLEAFTELLAKDAAKDFKDAPERMMQLLAGICALTVHCQGGPSLTADEYEVHRGMSVLVRDFLEYNKPSVERRPELQALLHGAAANFLRYPSVCVQLEATSMLPHLLRASLPEPSKTGPKVEPPSPPAWLRVKEELMPLLFLCAHRRVPPTFDFFALPAGYLQALAATSELDAEEDLPGVQMAIKGRLRETMAALMPSPAATLAALQFLQELLPRALGAAPDSSTFLTYEAALSLFECLVPYVKAKSGPQALESLRALLSITLQAPAHSPEHEGRRLEFLGRAGGALDELAEGGAGGPEAIALFQHVFKVVESGHQELRRKALVCCVAVCKAAPRAIRPVLQALVDTAVGLLKCIPEEQHILCEALVAASTSAQNFDAQQGLIQNLLGPLVAQWTPLAESLAAPGKLASCLLGDRAELASAHSLLQCFWACFRSSTVPSRPEAAVAGGFAIKNAGSADFSGVTLRNPAAGIAAAVLPGLAAVFRAFHAAFPSDGTRQPAGLDQASAAKLQTYLFGLDKEEVKALTSSLDAKRNDEGDTWSDPLPPPPGEDAGRVLQGRQLVSGMRSTLYKCLGAAFGVQDGVLTHPELASMLNASFLEGLEGAHPYHVELQLRNIWLVTFAPSGLQTASVALRRSFAAAVLPRLLPAAAAALQRSWQRLQQPDASQHAASGGFAWTPPLLALLCTGTVMASRTFVELAAGLAMHGAVPGASPLVTGAPAAAAAAAAAAQQAAAGGGAMEAEKPGKKKGKERTSAAAAAAKGGGGGGGGKMTDAAADAGGDGAGKAPLGFAGIVFTNEQVLEAVQGALCMAVRWPDPKAVSHALSGMQGVAVRLMSGGDTYQALRDIHATHPEAPHRSLLALRAVLQPLAALCAAPPAAPPGDSALHTVIGKPFFDFFNPEKQRGPSAPSPFAEGVTSAFWPIVWGMCQVFIQVCKTNHIKATPDQVVNFPALLEACQLLASFRRVDQHTVQTFLAAMLEESADAKFKRGALRNIVRVAVDPEAAAGELLA